VIAVGELVNFDEFLTVLYGAFHLYWFDKYVSVDDKLQHLSQIK